MMRDFTGKPWPKGLHEDEAAFFVGVSHTTFRKLVSEGKMPQPLRIGGRVIYDRDRLSMAMESLSDEPDMETALLEAIDRAPKIHSAGRR